MSVYINNNVLPVQPSELREYYIQIQSDVQAWDGAMQRNRVGQKKAVDMGFTIMSPSDYQTTTSYFTTGSGVYYYNDQSSYTLFTFSGLPLYSEDAYVQGGSLYRPLRVTIREQ